MAGHYFSGGSTISQQVAGNLYEDRSETTLGRKLAELWWSFQLEKKRSKLEILEIYLNNSQFGHGNYGVESASKFYFGHGAAELSLAEATLLTVHLSNPVTRSMINYPNRARNLQQKLLQEMVAAGYVDKERAEAEFEDFWARFEPVRANNVSTHTELTDRATEFSALIRRRFDELFYASPDLYRDGFIIHSGLDLDYQARADELLDETITRISRDLEQDRSYRQNLTDDSIIPAVELLSLVFGIDGVDFYDPAAEAQALVAEKMIDPILLLDEIFTGGMIAQHFDYLPEPDQIVVSGELVAIDNQTGQILALSSRRSDGHTDASYRYETLRHVGSTLAPLIYAQAVDTKSITASQLVYDSPAYFLDMDRAISVPSITATYQGAVPAWRTVSNNLISPMTTIVEGTGVEVVSLTLEGLLSGSFGPDAEVPDNAGLAFGGIRATTLQVAGAIASIVRDGRPMQPLAIQYIEDRYGRPVPYGEPSSQRDVGRTESYFSIAAAHITAEAMKRTLDSGSLSRRIAEIGGVGRRDFSAVSGSTANWSDAWVAGFSSHITVVVWIGFESSGESFGQYQTGASIAGPVWARFMADVHQELPALDYDSTPNGVIYRQVCAVSGLLPTDSCVDGIETVPFMAGTEPTTLCDYHTALGKGLDLGRGKISEYLGSGELPESVTRRNPIRADLREPDDSENDASLPVDADTRGSNRTNPYLD